MRLLPLFFSLLLLLPALPTRAADGAKLYAQNCAACHGERGSGGIGVPLALPAFHALSSEDYLRKSIRLGRPGRVMPTFAALSDAEVDAIVAHIGSWNPGSFPSYPTTRIDGNVANGGKLFLKHCASCHGANGEGGKGTGVTLSRPREQAIVAPVDFRAALSLNGILMIGLGIFSSSLIAVCMQSFGP